MKYLDGEYRFDEIKDCLERNERGLSCFQSEAHFCDFLEKRIERFCKDNLGYEIQSYQREYEIGIYPKTQNPRIDFYIKTKCGKSIGLECKHPNGNAEYGRAVGQCLAYLISFEKLGNPLDKIIIVSTKLSDSIPAIVSKFNLPVGFIAMDNDKVLTYLRTEKKKSWQHELIDSISQEEADAEISKMIA